jgi:rsbT co-antagonist protein RsbR
MRAMSTAQRSLPASPLPRVDESWARQRREFFEITDGDLHRLASLRAFAERKTGSIVDAFYDLLLGHSATRTFFQDAATIARVKGLQRQYFLGLFAGKCDLAYAEERLRVGATNQRIGLDPTWYLGAYRRYLHLVHSELLAERPPDDARLDFASIKKIVFFDMALAIDTYIAAHLEDARRHQVALRELSTPVIRAHEGVLLLPLIGAVDSGRAGAIMDAVLSRIVEERARCIIIDIAGVPVMDTQVADSLIKTVASIRLLGATAILTGITAPVARTIVRMGVSLPADVPTCAGLAEGIEMALQCVGKRIVADAPT